jgi:hypothetical protein
MAKLVLDSTAWLGEDVEDAAPEREATGTGLEGQDAVVLLEQAGDVGRRDPSTAQPAQVGVGRPTGDGATLSDVDRDLVVAELREQLAERRDADTLDAVRRLLGEKLSRVAPEHDGHIVSDLEGSVRGDVKRNRGAGRIAGSRAAEVQRLHLALP